MKSMILAAGKGTRLKPLTLDLPKPLVKVGKLSLIEYHLIALKKANIFNVIINYSWLSEKMRNYFLNRVSDDLDIHLSYEQRLLETGGAILKVLPFFENNPFVIISSDVFTTFDYSVLKKKSLDGKLAHLVLVRNPDHNQKGDFSLKGGTVSRIVEGGTSFTYSGIGLLSPKLFQANINQDRFKLSLLLNHAVDQNLVSGELFEGQWLDVGTLERLDQAKALLNQH